MVSTRVHGMIDYLAASVLGGLSVAGPFSTRVRAVLGAASAYHAGYSVLTDYEAGVTARVTMRQHLVLDALGAAALCGTGLAMRGVRPRERALLVAAGLAELTVVGLSDSQPVSGPGQGSGPIERLSGRSGSSDAVAYLPFDEPKPVAEGVWVVDSAPLRTLGLALPVRMTVIRLVGGDLLLHSPTRCSIGLRRELDRIGRVRHLVAPNVAHWTFLQEWQQSYPDAVTWAVPGLRGRPQVRGSGVRLDHELGDAAPSDWAGEIRQAIIHGGAGFSEAALFHVPTRTLVLTDLVLNIEPRTLPTLVRPVARALGIVAPDGRAPAYLRAIVKLRRDEAAAAASRVLEWGPERVIFAHGRWFERDGEAALRRSLRWLVP